MPPLLLLVLALVLVLSVGNAAAAITPASVQTALQICKAKPEQDFAQCVARTLYSKPVKALLTQIMDGIEARRAVEADYGAHVCREGVGSAEPLASEVWERPGHGPMRVDRLFESQRGQAAVYLAHDFVFPAECQLLR